MTEQISHSHYFQVSRKFIRILGLNVNEEIGSKIGLNVNEEGYYDPR